MQIRLYYKPKTGKIVAVVLISDEDWNLLELNPPVKQMKGCEEYTFELTEENLEAYMDGPHNVNLQTIGGPICPECGEFCLKPKMRDIDGRNLEEVMECSNPDCEYWHFVNTGE